MLDQDTVHTESHQTTPAGLQAVSSASTGSPGYSEGRRGDTSGNLTDVESVEIEMQAGHEHMDVSAVIDEVNAQDSTQENFY